MPYRRATIVYITTKLVVLLTTHAELLLPLSENMQLSVLTSHSEKNNFKNIHSNLLVQINLQLC